MFSKILVAYDGSPTSRSALTQADELAQAEDADVTVVTVAPSVAPLAAIAPGLLMPRRWLQGSARVEWREDKGGLGWFLPKKGR